MFPRFPAGTLRQGCSGEDAFARDDSSAARARAISTSSMIGSWAFVGKLIVNKGVDLLLAAWPLVLERVPEARLVVVGFGADRELMEHLLDTLAAGALGPGRGADRVAGTCWRSCGV